ncbi:MAG: hypothetical protein J6U54_12935 [Clostridiales bacterium]|nr:hypothetical protein [Clostridiales bacterium]
MTPEARENRLVSLAMDLAEERLLDGTASNQLIVHYLKLGTTKEQMEKEMMEKQMRNLDAKTEAIESAKRVEELYEKAINAMRLYSGQKSYEEIDDT